MGAARAGYLTQRNPFVYFHSIVDTPDCGANIAPVSRLLPDAQDAESAPNFSLVVPDACHDGRDPRAPTGAHRARTADEWLKSQLEPLLASKAYADDGLVVSPSITAPTRSSRSARCCSLPHIKAGAVDQTPYTHTGLLKTIEDAFSLEHLGKAKATRQALGDDVFSITTPSR